MHPIGRHCCWLNRIAAVALLMLAPIMLSANAADSLRRAIIRVLQQQRYEQLSALIDSALIDTTTTTCAIGEYERQSLELLSGNPTRFFAAAALFPDFESSQNSSDSLTTLATTAISKAEQLWSPWLDTLHNAEQREVLSLFLASANALPYPDAHRRAARRFMRTNRQSDYLNLVDACRIRLNRANWQMFAGYAHSATMGDMRNHTRLNAGASIGVGGMVNRLYTTASLCIGRGTLLYPILHFYPESGTPFDVNKGSTIRYMQVSFRAGWPIYSRQRARLLLLCGLSSLSLSLPPMDGLTSAHEPIASTAAFCAGAMAQWECLQWGTQRALGLQLNTLYSTHFNRNLYVKGSAITLEAGLFLRFGDTMN